EDLLAGTMEGWDKKTFKKVAKAAASNFPNSYKGLTHLSDVARLLYLYHQGGHHFDVDMGLGRMDTGRRYHHNDPKGLVPLFGAVAVTSEGWENLRVPTISPSRPFLSFDPNVRDDASRIIKTAPVTAQNYLNGMLATRKNNERVLMALSAM